MSNKGAEIFRIVLMSRGVFRIRARNRTETRYALVCLNREPGLICNKSAA